MTYAPCGDAPAGPKGNPAEPRSAGSEWTVGPWRVDADTGDLRREGAPPESQRVEPKVAEVLVYLAQRAGQVVSRDELLNAVWPGVVVGDDALTQAVIKLRKALGDDAWRPEYIETLAKRGYRLIAPVSLLSPVMPAVRVAEAKVAPPVEAAEAPEPAEAPTPATVPPAPRKPWRLAALAGGVAARRVDMHEQILRLPMGYDTLLGTDGSNLSGGQRQRIGLARALYGDPSFIVLDEPNSNLDESGQKALLDAVGALKAAGKTVVLITHRMSALGAADKVLVLADGALAAYGPRDEVLKAMQERGGGAPARRPAAPRPATPLTVATGGAVAKPGTAAGA
jgi:DNA-binding winged helix-turn-helix (wHTH) protein